jgi:hypothetical protein
MTVLSVGQLQSASIPNEITIESNTKLKIDGILRVSSIQNSSGITTLSSTSSGQVTVAGNLSTTSNITANTITPSRLVIPSWTSLTRPSNPVAGSIGYNSTTGTIEYYKGTSWDKIQGIAPSGIPTDQYWNNVRLLIKNGSTSDFTGRHTITNTGSATTVSSVPSFKGTGTSWSLGQNTSSGLTIGNNFDDFALGTNTVWTLEFWVYLLNTNAYPHYFVPGGQNAQGTFKAFWSGGTFRPYMYTGNGLIVGSNNNSSITSSGQWVWMVYQRDGANMRLWINGSIYETSTSGGSINTGTPSSCISGYWSGEAVPFYIDELRLTLGVARYGTSNTISVQSSTWPTTS